MDNIDIPDLVQRLGSEEDSVRKMAVFKLQSAIGDPSFSDVFMLEGGLAKLSNLCLHATGNTLAYALTSFSRLLELDKGWDHVSPALIERVRLAIGEYLIFANALDRQSSSLSPNQ
jgi:engulfment/cell motility protein 1